MSVTGFTTASYLLLSVQVDPQCASYVAVNLSIGNQGIEVSMRDNATSSTI